MTTSILMKELLIQVLSWTIKIGFRIVVDGIESSVTLNILKESLFHHVPIYTELIIHDQKISISKIAFSLIKP